MVLLRRLTLLISVLLIASTCYAGRYFDATEYATLTGLGVSTTGDTWYVDGTNGSDSYDGKAAARVGTTSVGPWKTINKAFASTTDGVNYGDHLLIRDGTYNERVTVRNLTDSGAVGSESNRFKMGAYGDGEVILRSDINSSVTWQVHSGTLYKFSHALLGYGPNNLVLDDNFTVCKDAGSIAACDTDGEFYWDGSTTTYLRSTSGTPNSRGVIVIPREATRSSLTRTGITLSGVSYVTIYGITQLGATIGVYDSGNSHHITLDYCVMKYNCKNGAAIYYNNSSNSGDVVSKCYFLSNVMYNYPRGKHLVVWGDRAWATSLRLAPGTTISGSIVQSGHGEGISFWNIADSVTVGGTIEDNIIIDNNSVNVYIESTDLMTICRNIILDNGNNSEYLYYNLDSSQQLDSLKRSVAYGISLGRETVSSNRHNPDHHYIYNNIIVGCRSGIQIYNEDYPGLFSDCVIYGNTIMLPNHAVPTSSGITYFGIDLNVGNASSSGNYIRNNVVLGSYSTGRLTRYGSAGVGVTFSDNLYYHPNASSPFYYGSDRNFATWSAYSNVNEAASSYYDDPDIALADYTAPNIATYLAGTVTDFNLEAGSQAINMGYTLGSPYNSDFNGVARIVYDAGALEYISSADSTAPATTSTLAAAAGTNPGEIDISWTSPGDDNTTGTASSYDVRWSTTSIDDAAEFAAATPISGEPTPSVAGTAEAFTATLTPGITYYFALQTSDEVPNLSGISNSPYATATPYPVDVIAYDSSSYAHTTAANNTLTWYHSITDAPHRALVIGTAIEDYTAGEYVVTGVTYNSVAASKITSIAAGTYNSTELWYLPEEDLPLASGGYAVTITTSGVCSFITGGAISIYATDQVVPTLYTTKSVTGTTSITTPITTTDANTMLIDAVQIGNLRTDFTATGMTEWIDLPYVTHQLAMSTRFVASPATVSNVWAIDGTAVNNFTHAIVGFSQFIAAPDTTAPAAVSSLLATQGAVTGSVNLSWTAPGDDGNDGTATSIDVRYSTSTITAANWSAATEATGEPSVADAGSPQAMTITGLTGGTPYFFALKTSDEVPNESGLSNVDTATPAALPIQSTGGCFGYRR